MKCIGRRTLELWPEFTQQPGLRQQFILDLRLKRIKFRLEFCVEKYLPRHVAIIMSYKTYAVKCIL
jgi:hypothetical protein